MQRITPDRAPGLPLPQAGPVGELHAHVALVPMLRLGPYVSHDISPGSGGAPDRQTTEAGLRVKLTPPLLPRPWRTWAFLGFGYARSYRPSHGVDVAASSVPGDATEGEVGGVEGDFVDTAFGVGIGTRVRGPWMFFAELAGRAGLVFWGAMYENAPCACLRDPYPGHDSFAASLSVGVSLDL